MDGYQQLALAVLDRTYHDLRRGPHGGRRRLYFGTRNFLNLPLFRLYCRLLGLHPDTVRRAMLRQAAVYRERRQTHAQS